METDRAIETYLATHWDEIVDDIATLVRIESTEDMDAAAADAPYGPGPKRALAAALRIAKRMGFATKNEDGWIGWADLPGYMDKQVGIIAHVDVVPEGPGWTYPAFDLTRTDGCLVGRGVLDDKGPLVVALHAMKFWKDALAGRGSTFPYTIRYLFGANEETNMRDVDYYRARYDDPAFLLTPDAAFPVSYGEKGIFHAWMKSLPIRNGRIVDIAGGAAMNAVPGEAYATLDVSDAEASRIIAAAEKTEGITAQATLKGLIRIDATGRAAHASRPCEGVNAIGILADFILGLDICPLKEAAFLDMARALCTSLDGSAFGLACEDDDFGALTLAGGLIEMHDRSIWQSIDVRFPTTCDLATLEHAFTVAARGIGASLELDHCQPVFLMDKESDAIEALSEAYQYVTKSDAAPITMAGGTYARKFTTGVSFGVEEDGCVPEWSGGMHGPDEAIYEDTLKQAFRIYVHAIENLMNCEL